MKIITKRSLPEMKRQLKELENEIAVMKTTVADLQRDVSAKFTQVEKLKFMIKRRENPGIVTVSDHAILRYLERVKGFNRQEIESEILSDDVIELISKLGNNGSYPNKAGFIVCMKSGTVTTIKK